MINSTFQHRWKFRVVGVFACSLIFILFQNCGKVHESITQSEQSSRAFQLQQEKNRVLSQNCASCHSSGSGVESSVSDIFDLEELIRNEFVKPGEPELSPLYLLVVDGLEPRGADALSSEDLEVLRQWIISLDESNFDGGFIGYVPPEEGGPARIPFADVFNNVIQPNCVGCHRPGGQKADLPLTNYAEVFAQISPGQANQSVLYQSITGQNGRTRMPQSGSLPSTSINQIYLWIQQGALENP